MIEIKLNDDEFKNLCLEEVRKRLDEVMFDSMLMDIKQLCKALSLSRPTVEKNFLNDPNFPAIRVGKKWLFNRTEVQEYVNNWSLEKRRYRRRG